MSEFAPVARVTQARVAMRLLRPVAHGLPRGKYVLFAQGRTGSTLFGEILASHPDVEFADEILRARVASTRSWVEGSRAASAARMFGFHVKIYQLTDVQRVADPGRWLRRMHRNGWTVLALRRRNLLRHVLSNMTIEATGAVHDRSGAAPAARQLTVDPAHVLHWIGVREQVGRDEQRALEGVPHLAICYEDDLSDDVSWQRTADRAFAYLGLPGAPVSASLRRRNPADLRDLVANYDELAEALRGTAYAQFLDE